MSEKLEQFKKYMVMKLCEIGSHNHWCCGCPGPEKDVQDLIKEIDPEWEYGGYEGDGEYKPRIGYITEEEFEAHKNNTIRQGIINWCRR